MCVKIERNVNTCFINYKCLIGKMKREKLYKNKTKERQKKAYTQVAVS